jgi:hypothetical protein
MASKPPSAAEYKREYVALVRSTCLYVATKLGDLMDDLVIVGGLVPSLLIDPGKLPQGAAAHVGTRDLDVGLALGLLDQGRYSTLAERLRGAGFRTDTNEGGNTTRQRWRISGTGTVTVDFLIQPSLSSDRGGRLRDLEHDFAAIIVPGLKLAFLDRERVTLEGPTLFGEKARREVWACGAGAFVVLKALAFNGRGANKDAYDLYYVMRNYGRGVHDVAAKLSPLLADPDARNALDILRNDFVDPEGLGPRRVAEFMTGGRDSDIQADVSGFVGRFLDRC